MLRILCDRFELNYGESKKFPTYYKLLNQERTLERQTVYFSKDTTACAPFITGQGYETPFWWKAYNDTKHDLPMGLSRVIYDIRGLLYQDRLHYTAWLIMLTIHQKSSSFPVIGWRRLLWVRIILTKHDETRLMNDQNQIFSIA